MHICMHVGEWKCMYTCALVLALIKQFCCCIGISLIFFFGFFFFFVTKGSVFSLSFYIFSGLSLNMCLCNGCMDVWI